MKVAFISTTHQSAQHRPNGHELTLNMLDSLERSLIGSGYEKKMYLYDNGSEVKLHLPDSFKSWVDYTYVENQYISGITGTWNDGIKKAMRDAADIIIINNDDVIFNSSINNFIDTIYAHELNSNAIYGPLSNNANNDWQNARGITDKISVYTDRPVNGFLMGFTPETVKNNYYDDNDNFFSTTVECMWGGQENEIQGAAGHKRRVKYSIVIGSSWIEHIKLRGWRKFHQMDEATLKQRGII